MAVSSSFREPGALHVQSNGGGVQSMAMYYQSSLGLIPRFDYSIFIDLGAEKSGTISAVHDAVLWAESNNGVPIVIVSNKNLLTDTLSSLIKNGSRFVSLPFFSSGSDGSMGMLRRQCTSEYKIRQVNRAIKFLQGKSGNQRYDAAYVWLGISLDEAHRMGNPEPVKFTYVFPYCDRKTGYDPGRLNLVDSHDFPIYHDRNQCKSWLVNNGFMVPPKSSCFFCPYTSDADWLDMQSNDPALFAKAVKFDNLVRLGKPGTLISSLFLHRSGVPLSEVDFKNSDTFNLFECSGHCHI